MKKTVPTLAASTTAIGTSVLGLVIARPEHDLPPPLPRPIPIPLPHSSASEDAPSYAPDPPSQALLRRSTSFPVSDMTSTATCTVHAVDSYATPSSFSHFAFSARNALRSTRSDTSTVQVSDARKKLAKSRPTVMKRHTGPKDGNTLPTHINDASDADLGLESASAAQRASPSTQPWMKRLSTFSTSNNSRQSTSRPTSTCFSHQSNGSTFLSTDGSATSVSESQMAPTSNPTSIPTSIPTSAPTSIPTSNPSNKLVKPNRPVSLRSPSFDSTTSKIPKPTSSRPTSSHQRSATMQERRTRDIRSAHDAFSHTPTTAHPTEIQWRSFFTPRIFTDPPPPGRRRNSTSIPNPIKRVCPDRKYKPTLISAAEPVARAMLEVGSEADHDANDRFTSPTKPAFSPSHPSTEMLSPYEFLQQESDVEQLKQSQPGSRRSFSISDWFPADSHSWKRPLSRVPVERYRKKGRPSPEPSPNLDGSFSPFNEPTEPSTIRYNPEAAAETFADEDFSLTPHQPEYHPTSERDSIGQHESSSIPPFPHQSTSLSNFGFADLESGVGGEKGHLYDPDSAKAVKGSPARRGPAIDTIFQELPPPQPHSRHTYLRDILQRSSYQDQHMLRPRHSVIHEEDQLSTPARSARQQSSPISLPPSTSTPEPFPPSPLDMPSLLEIRNKESFDDSGDDRESSWSFGLDEDKDEKSNATPRLSHLELTGDLLHPSKIRSSSAAATPQRGGMKQLDIDTRSSIFDWSEQQPFDRSPGTHSPPRPKTVHGKKDAENRSGRSGGRRAPSGAHVRSQSVPAAQEADGTRVQLVSNKFGTWGVGSKGVTEDWNEDFEFDDVPQSVPTTGPGDEKRLDSGVGMLVPLAIREQQNKVLANIGLLKDWGLLIEEIKELRMRALALDLVDHTKEPTWNEVEAMIDLADQESDEHTLAPRSSPPSSPSFNYDDFDEPLTLSSTNRPSVHGNLYQRKRPAETLSGSPPRMDQEIRIIPATPRRPRKNSEAIARSVIEALQHKRIAPDSGPILGRPSEKVHFDTATLRRIIPYVQDLRDRVKAIFREAEGLYASPTNHGELGRSPDLSKKYANPPESPTTQRPHHRSIKTTDDMTFDDGFQDSQKDLAARLRIMTAV